MNMWELLKMCENGTISHECSEPAVFVEDGNVDALERRVVIAEEIVNFPAQKPPPGMFEAAPLWLIQEFVEYNPMPARPNAEYSDELATYIERYN